jgi:glyoxylase-like metal-dependent hydrolase (beta-lactamase superfamily II)
MHAAFPQTIVFSTSRILLLFVVTLHAVADAPMIQSGITQKISENVYVIPDNRVSLVPNIGIIVGDNGIMVVDTGMGPRNAEIVLQEVRKISDKEITYLAITHFHPEHGMGAQSFPETTNIVVPTAQKQELADKGEAYIELFNDFSPEIADLLSDVKLVIPDLAFENKLEIDLGGTTVQLFHFDTAHTRGDMFVFLPEQKILFGGDIIINRFFPIMPDGDSRALGWINSLTELKALKPEIVVPGHGAVADISLIDQLLVFLTNLKQRVAESKTQGLSLAQAQELLIPEFQKKYSNWDESNWIKNAVERFYAEI